MNITNDHIGLYLIENEVFASYKFLSSRGFGKQVIDNNISRNRNTNYWNIIKWPPGRGENIIEYASIRTKKKDLPKIKELKVLLLQYQENENKIKENKELTDITKRFEWAYHYNWQKYYQNYISKIKESSKSKIYAQTEALFQEILLLNSEGIPKNKLFQVFLSLKQSVKLSSKINNQRVFYSKLQLLERYHLDLSAVLINGLTGKKSNNSKFGKKTVLLIKQIAKIEQPQSNKDIRNKANTILKNTGLQEVSLSTVKQIIKTHKIEIDYYRKGREYRKNYIQPYHDRIKPENPGDVFCIDGTKFQFEYLSEEGSIENITLCPTFDGHSKMILAYTYGQSENTDLILGSLRKAIAEAGYIPPEIIYDNHPSTKSEKFKYFENALDSIGCIFRKIFKGNPNDNLAERNFLTFQTCVCQKEYGYIGPGIKSIQKHGKPTYNTLKEYRKKKNLRKRSELISLLEKLIDKYNKEMVLNSISNTPQRCYNSKLPINTIKLQNWHLPLLYWHKTHFTLKKSKIIVQYKGRKFKYENFSPKILLKQSLKRLDVRFNPLNTNQIYIYEGFKFIGVLEKSIESHMAQVNQSEVDVANRKKFKSKKHKLIYDISKKNKDERKLVDTTFGKAAIKDLTLIKEPVKPDTKVKYLYKPQIKKDKKGLRDFDTIEPIKKRQKESKKTAFKKIIKLKQG